MGGLSLREASAIAEVPEAVIRTALEKKSVRPRAQRIGKSRRYQFEFSDLLFIKLLSQFPFPLSKEDKAALRQLVTLNKGRLGRWQAKGADLILQTGEMTILIQCKTMRDQVTQNLAVYRQGEERIVSNPDILAGEPMFAGTRIPLDHIVGLLRKKVDRREILEDYPALNEQDLLFAEIHARIGPKPGRPRKKLKIRRAKKAA